MNKGIKELKTDLEELKQKFIDVYISISKSTLIFEFNDISTFLKGHSGDRQSSSSYFRDLFWHLGIRIKKENEIPKWLGIYLNAESDDQNNKNWSIKVNYEVQLLSEKSSLNKTDNYLFDKIHYNMGWSEFITIDELTKEDFVKNDRIVLKVYFKEELNLN